MSKIFISTNSYNAKYRYGAKFQKYWSALNKRKFRHLCITTEKSLLVLPKLLNEKSGIRTEELTKTLQLRNGYRLERISIRFEDDDEYSAVKVPV